MRALALTLFTTIALLTLSIDQKIPMTTQIRPTEETPPRQPDIYTASAAGPVLDALQYVVS